MPLRRHRLQDLTTRLVLLSLAAVCLAVLRPAGRARVHDLRAPKPKRRSGLRRAAVSLTFATLFFAGAAFSAGAGDTMVQLVEDQASSVASAAGGASVDDPECDESRRTAWESEACPAESSEGAEPPPSEGDPEDPAAPDASPDPGAGESEPAPDPAPDPASPETASPSTTAAIAEATAQVVAVSRHRESGRPGLDNAARESGQQHAREHARPHRRNEDHARAVIARRKPFKHAATPDPEVELPGLEPTIWLHRALPDPTPPSKRLTGPFARNLRYASAKHRVDWALMLGVLRARGDRGSVPAGKVGLDRLGRNLARLGARNDQWSALLGLEGRTAFADRALALTRYHRAVGLRALVRGLESAKPRLTKRLLRDRRVWIYSGGRGDLAAGRIDVRVIVLIQYLAESHGQASVSSLKSGHGIYSRPGVVSAHTYGQAVDISGLAGRSIIGNQEPGGLTETAVRNVLLLPAELRPMQVISLLGLGGPSFPMGNHDDHIHLGY